MFDLRDSKKLTSQLKPTALMRLQNWLPARMVRIVGSVFTVTLTFDALKVCFNMVAQGF